MPRAVTVRWTGGSKIITRPGEAESASWLGGAPCARVVDPEMDAAEVVQVFRLTPRDE